MFNQNKKSNEIRPENQKPKDNKDEKNKSPLYNKDAKQENSSMRSEGEKN